MKRVKVLRFSLHEKMIRKELLYIRWSFRENRKGVFNFYRKLRKEMNMLNDDLN